MIRWSGSDPVSPGGGGAAGAGVRPSGAGRGRLLPSGLRAGGVPGLPPDGGGLQPQLFRPGALGAVRPVRLPLFRVLLPGGGLSGLPGGGVHLRSERLLPHPGGGGLLAVRKLCQDQLEDGALSGLPPDPGGVLPGAAPEPGLSAGRTSPGRTSSRPPCGGWTCPPARSGLTLSQDHRRGPSWPWSRPRTCLLRSNGLKNRGSDRSLSPGFIFAGRSRPPAPSPPHGPPGSPARRCG